MLECKDVCFSYFDGKITLDHISCKIKKGSFILICGPSGCGKTSMTRLFNGLIPHYYDGIFSGSVTCDGKEIKDLSLFELSKVTGSVFQNPASQFFNVDTTSELAFGPENHGLPREKISENVNAMVDKLDLSHLRDRSIFALSGGEKQKIACGSAGAIQPEIFIFDEPSSNLDSSAIEDLRKYLITLKEEGKTVIIAEHRLYYLSGLPDRVFYMKDGKIKRDYTLEEFQALDETEHEKMGLRPWILEDLKKLKQKEDKSIDKKIEMRNFHFSYGHEKREALAIEKYSFEEGSVTALIGHNGAGKTTFARCLSGLEKRCKGVVSYEGKVYGRKDRLKLCYMVMQDVNHQLFTESVEEEILLSMEKEDKNRLEEILVETDLCDYACSHPMGLSGGQKQRVAIASAIASERPVIIFDEPTSGLDLAHMRQVADSVNRLAALGKTVIIVTHDPEFILRCCNHVIQMENGQIIQDYALNEEKGRERLLEFFLSARKGGKEDLKKEKKQSPIGILMNWGRAYKGKYILSIVLAIIGVVCQMIPYFCMVNIIGKMLEKETDFKAYAVFCTVAFGAYIGKVFFSNLSTIISHKAAYETLRELREKVVNKLARMPMGTIMNTPSGEYKNVIVDRIETMEVPLAHLLPEMTSYIIVPLFIILYLFVLDWRMALLSLASMVTAMIVMSIGMRNFAEEGEGAMNASKKMTDSVVEYIGGIEVVKAFSQSAGSYKKYAEAVRGNRDYYIDWMARSQKTMCTYNAILPSVLIFVLPGGLALWINGSLDAVTFMASVIFSLGLIGPIMEAFSFMSSFALIGKTTEDINKLLEGEELHHSEKEAVLKGNKIELKNVRFGYNNEEVLHGIDLEIEEGQMTAIVGPSGSGKSTIAKLIAGYFDVKGGSILFGRKDMKEIPLFQLASRISYVSQDNYLFNRTIRENIRMGREDATDDEVEEAARRSGCQEFIDGLEKGYDTIAGSGGTLLSGGERQRIAIARAMLKDAPVIILDEATAFIDPENEAVIQKAISALTKGKTLIVIAHRLSTITEADKIVVINDGRIESQGTQAELLKQCELYQNMWKAHMDAKDEE